MIGVARDPNQASHLDSGNQDMHTVNENGGEAGRYLFIKVETGWAGFQRTDLRTLFTAPCACMQDCEDEDDRGGRYDD